MPLMLTEKCDALRREGKCQVCGEVVKDDDVMRLVNSEGSYGMPEIWACEKCFRDAPEGSRLAALRDGIYAEDFAAC